jgi:RNA polymerase sigma factor (sigma-70 family)
MEHELASATGNNVIQVDPHGERVAMSASAGLTAGGGSVPAPTGRRSAAGEGVRVIDGCGRGDDWERGLRDRLIAGDESAVADLYDQFASFVFGLARRVTGDRSAAEDVAQDVFVACWERPDAFDPDRGRLRTFLGTLAHRRAVDWVRREEARRRRAARDAALVVRVPDVEEMVSALATAERVRAEVERLPAEQAEAIRLAYFGGRTYRQVAIELGIPEGTAKSRLRLGLRRIAAALEANGVEQWT